MADIFISYKREEAEQAERLANVLEQFGYSVWWDVALLSGDEYRDVIAQMIDKCAAVIVLWSPLAVKSKFVCSEANYAQRQEKLLPAMLAACNLPLGFDESHADDLSSWQGAVRHPGLQRLLHSIENKTGKAATMGAKPSQSAAQKAEMTAFQGAAKMNSHGAWAQFLKDYPATTFRDFISVKMDELTPQTAPSPPPAAPPSPVPTPEPSSTTRTSQRGGSKGVILLLLLFVLGGLGAGLFYLQKDKTKTGEEIVVAARKADDSAWAVAKSADTQSAYRSYLSAYSNGRHASDARAAIARLDKPTPFDVNQLHPDVRRAVLAARDVETLAKQRAALARNAAKRADEAAARARAGATGTKVSSNATGIYETEYRFFSRNGVGVRKIMSGDFKGDIYRGEWKDGKFSGLGIYEYSERPSNTSGSLRYEGDYANDKKNGHGVFTWRSGDSYAGGEVDDLKSGPGVYRFVDGRRYEGDWANGDYNGLGVSWSASGEVLDAGRWKDGKLVEAMSK